MLVPRIVLIVAAVSAGAATLMASRDERHVMRARWGAPPPLPGCEPHARDGIINAALWLCPSKEPRALDVHAPIRSLEDLRRWKHQREVARWGQTLPQRD